MYTYSHAVYSVCMYIHYTPTYIGRVTYKHHWQGQNNNNNSLLDNNLFDKKIGYKIQIICRPNKQNNMYFTNMKMKHTYALKSANTKRANYYCYYYYYRPLQLDSLFPITQAGLMQVGSFVNIHYNFSLLQYAWIIKWIMK